MPDVEVHPVQTTRAAYREGAQAPKTVTMRAYEVYCHVYGSQEAMVTRNCRGGFSAGELIVFLYAHSFPREEWRDRVGEAFKGMKNL